MEQEQQNATSEYEHEVKMYDLTANSRIGADIMMDTGTECATLWMFSSLVERLANEKTVAQQTLAEAEALLRRERKLKSRSTQTINPKTLRRSARIKDKQTRTGNRRK